MSYSPEFLLESYRTMKTIRLFEERVIKEFEAGNIPGFVHAYDGQEAVAVGVCMNLTDKDVIGSTHRGHGHCIAKGCDVVGMMKEIMGKAGGLCKGKGGSMHIADFDKGMLGANAIVGGGPPLCNGAALSAKTLGTKDVAVSFSGDGSSNQGTVAEALNLAVVLKLPHVFMFENNGYGEGTGADYAVGSGDVAGRAGAYGMPSAKMDGIDFFAVYEATREAVERARRGEGPTALEADVVRFDGHFIGDPQLYRAKGEIKQLRADRDCLKHFRARVTGEGWLSDAQLDEIDESVTALVEKAAAEGLAAPQPDISELYTDVYISY
ncbi:thiamine pyrophosphate-dependent dehydrogenase E1 component subunit alpha [Parahaliea aestuarii]|uniref:Thiamine pyrophosphate-dependent dehydrogenase E1 component subunit alpha n=1 Tax=Parahaliea aestuarii TaxID=1852021 RepID=A0A5C9A5M4_9GAMM|nr:thiamine pyrophosphate-dependent dehydrogenase E1 component subunit alpha [Parahaliea aestuarii]TXS95050.1 thiamine pyrophosphate-dependent dehydrogenase E1 component subunit alpha [Parahaliea aestuarii]